MALFWRIWAAVALVNLAVLSIFVALATLQYGRIESALVGERLLVMADRTATPFASTAGLGLPLATVRNAPAVLERARQGDENIVAIHVFDAAGRIVHSTVPEPPAAIPDEAVTARASGGGAPWYREAAPGFLGGVEIFARDGTSAGGVLIVYPRRDSVMRIWAMAAGLALAAIAVLLASGLIAALALRIGLARQIALFRALDDAVAAFEWRSWRSATEGGTEPVAAGAAPTEDPGASLHALLVEAEARYRDTGRALARVGTEGR